MYDDEEIWKEIPYAPGYEFSTHERLRSYRRTSSPHLQENPRILSVQKSTTKPRYQLCVGKNKIWKTPSALLREVFEVFRCGWSRRSNDFGCNRLIPLEDKAPDRRLCNECGAYRKRCVDLKKRYKLTPKQHDDMFWEQNGRCRICDEELPLVVDHNGKTGKIRGLLCNPHNLGIGLFNHDPMKLRAAAEYLEKTDN